MFSFFLMLNTNYLQILNSLTLSEKKHVFIT